MEEHTKIWSYAYALPSYISLWFKIRLHISHCEKIRDVSFNARVIMYLHRLWRWRRLWSRCKIWLQPYNKRLDISARYGPHAECMPNHERHLGIRRCSQNSPCGWLSVIFKFHYHLAVTQYLCSLLTPGKNNNYAILPIIDCMVMFSFRTWLKLKKPKSTVGLSRTTLLNESHYLVVPIVIPVLSIQGDKPQYPSLSLRFLFLTENDLSTIGFSFWIQYSRWRRHCFGTSCEGFKTSCHGSNLSNHFPGQLSQRVLHCAGPFIEQLCYVV